MATVVKSTPEALNAITQMSNIINSGLTDQITQLNNQGQTLSDPGNWDGPLAQQFQGSWPETHANLNKMKQDLDALRDQVQRINDNIQSAGGN